VVIARCIFFLHKCVPQQRFTARVADFLILISYQKDFYWKFKIVMFRQVQGLKEAMEGFGIVFI